KAEALALPGEDFLAEQMAVVDVEAVYAARQEALKTLAQSLGGALRDVYAAHDERAPYEPSPAQMGRRALKAAALAVLNAAGEASARALALAQFERGANMTGVLSALTILRDQEGAARD